jgi:hypothetical protein
MGGGRVDVAIPPCPVWFLAIFGDLKLGWRWDFWPLIGVKLGFESQSITNAMVLWVNSDPLWVKWGHQNVHFPGFVNKKAANKPADPRPLLLKFKSKTKKPRN